MKKNKSGKSFIEFVNNAPNKSEPSAIEKPMIPESVGLDGVIKRVAEELVMYKMAIEEVEWQKKVIDRDNEIHARLVKFLDSIVNNGEIKNEKDSRFILNVCNEHPNMTFTIRNGRVFKNAGHLMEKTQFAIRDLFEFLADPKNIKRIKKCPYCDLFFLAKDIKRKNHCYSTDCERKYQREKKQEQRDSDPVKYV